MSRTSVTQLCTKSAEHQYSYAWTDLPFLQDVVKYCKQYHVEEFQVQHIRAKCFLPESLP